MPPLGCAPYMLALFPGAPGDYDRVTGCDTRLNALAELHNGELKRTLDELRRAHPGRSLLYGDVYCTIRAAVTSPAKFGTQITQTPLQLIRSTQSNFFAHLHVSSKSITRLRHMDVGRLSQVSATRRWPRAAAARTTSSSRRSVARRGRRRAPTRPSPSRGMGSTSPRRPTGS